MRPIKLATLILALACSVQAGVYFKTGLELLSDGQHWNKHFTEQSSTEYISGAVTYFQGYVCGVVSAERHSLNIPAGAQVDQLCKIVFDYLQNNPSKLHKPASDIIVEALEKAFPPESFQSNEPKNKK